MSKVKSLFKLILEITIVLYVFIALKQMRKIQWLYYFFLWFFSLLAALFPASLIHVLVAGSNSLGNILYLPWTFYLLYIPFTLVIFWMANGIVNSVLIAIGEEDKAGKNTKHVIIGFLLVLITLHLATGGISEMKRKDEAYKRQLSR